MRLTRCYLPGAWRGGDVAALPRGQAEHLLRVLRLTVDQEVELFDGHGRAWRGRLASTERGRETVRIESSLPEESPASRRIVLLQSLARGEKMDFIVQKATELGVAAIWPVAADHSVVRLADRQETRKLEHWRAVAVSACEQCGRNQLPDITAPAPLEHLTRGADGGSVLWALQPQSARSLAAAARDLAASSDAPPGGEIRLAIGPEGGFSAAETALLAARGAVAVGMGPRILRTETAALAALAILQALLGDLG